MFENLEQILLYPNYFILCYHINVIKFSLQAVATTDSGDRGGGWLSSVGNFLAKSFYW